MVTLIASAVAVGVVSVCAIPLGCFISRKIRKKVRVPPNVANELESEDGDRASNSILRLNLVDDLNESQYQIEEIWSRYGPGDRRSPRVEIRVLVSSGSMNSTDLPSQGYVTASRASSEEPTSQGGVPARAIEARSNSLQNLTSGPAADGKIQTRSTSLPMAARTCESVNQGSLTSDTTRFEITISGPYSRSVAQSCEFLNDIPESSTPKSKSYSFIEKSENQATNVQRSSFWRRGSCNKNERPNVSKTTREIEVINVQVLPGDETRQWRNSRSELATEAGERRYRGRKKSCKSKPEDAKSSTGENGTTGNRGKWGLPGRFFDTFRETTNFATL